MCKSCQSKEENKYGEYGYDVFERLLGVEFSVRPIIKHGPGNTVLAYEINVNANEKHHEGRQQLHVEPVEPGESHHTHAILSPDQPFEIRSGDRNTAGDLSSYDSAPVRAVIPRQLVTREAEAESQQEQYDSDVPCS